MYQSLITFHSLWRWAVLLSLIASILMAWQGLSAGRHFGRRDNAARHWTATIAHIQLVLGILLYSQSPVVRAFPTSGGGDSLFFAIIHSLLMLTAILLITVGSALAKRRSGGDRSFRTMLAYYGIAVFLILISIPWPFSPLAQRPLYP